jgi:hypothetical protein
MFTWLSRRGVNRALKRPWHVILPVQTANSPHRRHFKRKNNIRDHTWKMRDHVFPACSASCRKSGNHRVALRLSSPEHAFALVQHGPAP